jgi:hypothetical protein
MPGDEDRRYAVYNPVRPSPRIVIWRSGFELYFRAKQLDKRLDDPAGFRHVRTDLDELAIGGSQKKVIALAKGHSHRTFTKVDSSHQARYIDHIIAGMQGNQLCMVGEKA